MLGKCPFVDLMACRVPDGALYSSVDMYGAPPSDVGTYPLMASSHAGLPPAFIQVQECDPLHDDGVVYEKVLRAAGVKTQLIQ